jgi:hypothetical protein
MDADQARMRNSSRSDVLHHLGSFFPLNLLSIFSPQNFRFLHNSYKTHYLQELIIRSMLNLCSEVSLPIFMISYPVLQMEEVPSFLEIID